MKHWVDGLFGVAEGVGDLVNVPIAITCRIGWGKYCYLVEQFRTVTNNTIFLSKKHIFYFCIILIVKLIEFVVVHGTKYSSAIITYKIDVLPLTKVVMKGNLFSKRRKIRKNGQGLYGILRSNFGQKNRPYH